MQTRFSFAVMILVGATFVNGSFTQAQESAEPASRTELKELLTKRRDVLRQLVKAMEEKRSIGVLQVDSVVAAREQLLNADLQLATTQKQRLEIYQERIDNMQVLEDSLKVRHQAVGAPVESLLAATAARLQAEIDLAREKESS